MNNPNVQMRHPVFAAMLGDFDGCGEWLPADDFQKWSVLRRRDYRRYKAEGRSDLASWSIGNGEHHVQKAMGLIGPANRNADWAHMYFLHNRTEDFIYTVNVDGRSLITNEQIENWAKDYAACRLEFEKNGGAHLVIDSLPDLAASGKLPTAPVFEVARKIGKTHKLHFGMNEKEKIYLLSKTEEELASGFDLTLIFETPGGQHRSEPNKKATNSWKRDKIPKKVKKEVKPNPLLRGLMKSNPQA